MEEVKMVPLERKVEIEQEVKDDDKHAITVPVKLVQFEYHIVYSISYMVPVLYFKATNSGKV